METQRVNFKTNAVAGEFVRRNDVVDVFSAGRYGDSARGVVVEINDIVDQEITDSRNRTLFQITGVVEFVDDIADRGAPVSVVGVV